MYYGITKEERAVGDGQDNMTIERALERAFALGQKYWQEADSEYSSHWKRADGTLAKFRELKALMRGK